MSEMLLTQNEDGTFGKYEPYITIAVDTEEDIKRLREAIEKQIPKKPNIHEGFMTVARCPVCNEITAFKNEYCSGCGQKLEWSKRDD